MGWADSVIITCEHGGNQVPRAYARMMKPVRGLLATHRGFDAGALELACDCAMSLNASLHLATTTRLLVDLNRSLDNDGLFGPSTRRADEATRRAITREHYVPYRRAVEADVRGIIRKGNRRTGKSHCAQGCTHISVHSFTPVLRGVKRNVDIGLLYDPARPRECELTDAWIAAMELMELGLTTRRNAPYKGTDDGFTTHLRTLHPDPLYAGIEIEVNQRLVRAGGKRWKRVKAALIAGLIIALNVTQPREVLPKPASTRR